MKFKSLLKLSLSFCVLFLGAQHSLASSGCADSLAANIVKKYNSEDSLKFNFTRTQLSKLKEAYHQLKVPDFVADISINEDRPLNAMKAVSNRFVETSKDGLAVFIPNTPVYHLAAQFEQYSVENRIHELKNNPNGLALSTWFMHPGLASYAAKNGAPIISEIESEGRPYIASMLDLNPSHIPHLKELKRLSLSHISRVYGVTEQDSVELFFHFPYAPKTVTLHLHVRVNQKTYGLEKAKSYTLDNVINTLERNEKIEDLILSRQLLNDGLYTNHGTAEGLVREMGIGVVKEAVNPFIED